MTGHSNWIAFVAFCVSVQLVGVARAVVIPNGNFDTLYKPGSTTVTAPTLNGGYTVGIGPNVQVIGPGASFTDSTGGNHVDVPGWTGSTATGVQEFPPSNGQFPAGANTAPYAVYVQGPAFGGGDSNLVTSDGLGALAGSTNYVLSIQVGWRNDVNPVADPVVLNLNANGTAITPDVSVSPPLVQGGFVTFSRSYSAASLSGLVGDTLSISFGTGANATGQQVEFDSARLVDTAVPEPDTVVLFGLGAVGLLIAARRRRSA